MGYKEGIFVKLTVIPSRDKFIYTRFILLSAQPVIGYLPPLLLEESVCVR